VFAIVASNLVSGAAFEHTTQKAGVQGAVHLNSEFDVIVQSGAVVKNIAFASRIIEGGRHPLAVKKRGKRLRRRRIRCIRGTRKQYEMNSDCQRVAALANCLNMRHDLPDM
jgi:hypothetical protein